MTDISYDNTLGLSPESVQRILNTLAHYPEPQENSMINLTAEPTATIDNTETGAFSLGHEPFPPASVISVIDSIAREQNIRIGVLNGIHYDSIAPEDVLANHGDTTSDVVLIMDASPTPLNNIHARSLEFYCFTTREARGGQEQWNLTINNSPNPIIEHSEYPTWTANDHYDEYNDALGTEWTMGWLAQNMVYLPWTIQGSPETLQYQSQAITLKKMLEDPIHMCQTSDLIANHARIAQDRLITTLGETIESRRSTRLAQLGDDITNATLDMQTHRTSAERAESNLRDLQPQYAAVARQRANPAITDPDRLRATIESIQNIPDIRRLSEGENDNEHLSIYTNLIDMTVNVNGMNYTAEAGKFGIHLEFGTPSIRISNEPEYCIEGYQHPHVSAGSFCLGGVRTLVNDLMKDMEFVTVVNVIIDQLKTVNPDDAYFPRWYEFFGQELENYYEEDGYQDDEEY